MARKSMILKQQKEAKYSSRRYNRCKICGRPHAYLRDYGVCRICFRELAYKGQIPGVRKASWSPAGNISRLQKSEEDGSGAAAFGSHSSDTLTS